MNRLPCVCFAALTLTTAVAPSGAAQPPVLRKGVSVELPVTRNAVRMADADREDSVILAVTRDGKVFYGITPTDPTLLGKRVAPQTKLYLKGDLLHNRLALRNRLPIEGEMLTG